MLKIPGKTFLVGEYAVLVDGEGLGLATGPEFTLSEEKFAYHPESAVGLFCHKHQFQFNKKIRNPYGVGGFGQSTAEFIFAWIEKNRKINSLSEIRNDYLTVFGSDKMQSFRPSGADLAIQILGQVTHLSYPAEESKTMCWPFAQLSFFVISTGLKVKTHEHLFNLDRRRLLELPQLSQKAVNYFFEKKEDLFLQQLKIWSEKLTELSLQHPEVTFIKNKLEQFSKIKLVKPCGALGADVCLVFFEKQFKQEVQDHLNSEKFKIQSDETQLVGGLLQ